MTVQMKIESNNNNSIVDGCSIKEELSNCTTSGNNDGNISNASNGGLRKGPWTAAEDTILMQHVRTHGEGNWNAVQKSTGLPRCGKSCRLRWANHLRPNLKKGPFTPEEEITILRLHARLGNKWARISTHLLGRTDNEIKNFWNTRLKRRQRAGQPLYPPEIERELRQSHKFNQNTSQFPNNQNPNLNAQLLMHPSHNFPTQHPNGIGPNMLLNQNFQNYPQFPNQMHNDLSLLQYATKLGHNQGQFRQQVGFGMTNFGTTTNSSNMMPSFPNVKTEPSSNQLPLNQASVPGPCTSNMNSTMFDAQQGGNIQNMHKMQMLPSLPQLVRGSDPNSNWGNGNSINMVGNNGGMNQQGDPNGLSGNWARPDCMNGGANNMVIKPDVVEAGHEKKWEDLSNLIDESPDAAQFQDWLISDVPSNCGAADTSGGGGGGSVLTDDGMALGIHDQHFVPPLTH